MDTPLEFIRTSIVCNLVIFLLFYIVSHKQINALFTTPNVSIILIFYFFITSFVISNLYDRDYQNCTFGHSPSYHSMVQIFTKVSSVIIPILIFLIIRELIKMEKKIMEETMYQEIHHEYEKHLTALYSQDRMDAYIRHDLINYIETYQRMNRNE